MQLQVESKEEIKKDPIQENNDSEKIEKQQDFNEQEETNKDISTNN